MHLRLAAATAVLACAANVAAEPQPYKPIFAAVHGMSLMRRDTSGYQPEQTKCNKGGDTCAAACDAGYDSCPSSHDDSTHCYNKAAAASCCTDGSGNSCDAGFYCTHDTKSETWCCPEGMDLAACAAAFTVAGSLEYATSTTHSTTSTTSTTPTSTSTTHVKTTTTEVKNTTSTYCPVSSGYSTAWSGSNTTVTLPTLTRPSHPSNTAPVVVPPPPATQTHSGASSTAVSVLLLVAAGAVALL